MFSRNKISIAVYFVTFNLSFSSCARILAVFPTPSISHQIVFRPLVQDLVRRGHEVTVITTDPVFPKGKALKNLTEIGIRDFSYKIWSDGLLAMKMGNKDDTLLLQLELILTLTSKIFKALLARTEVQDIINKKNGEYDLLILEAFIKPLLAFTHIFKVPTIQISSFGGLEYNYQSVGAPTHPLLYPTLTHKRLYNLSQYEKLQYLYDQYKTERLFGNIEQEDDKLLKNIFGEDVPPIRELLNNVDMLFLNIHPIWSENQPVPPNVVYIGGIHASPSKELPTDLNTLLNKSRNGVIYFSLGTNVRSSILTPKVIEMMTKVFAELPYDVIWKWDLDSMSGKTDNIKLYKWLPQSDLLRHPKIKLFITQGGLQSTDEAIDAGVPVIGIPIFADQWYNAEKYPHHKIGITLDLNSLTEEVFRESIITVISDTSYRENIKRLRAILRDAPQTPLERAVWWTEYVLRHGGAKHLRAAGANISWAQYLELELVTTIALVTLAVLVLLLLILYYAWNLALKYVYGTKIKIKKP